MGMVTDETELTRIEEHLLACQDCVRRAENTADYIDAVRATIITGNWEVV